MLFHKGIQRYVHISNLTEVHTMCFVVRRESNSGVYFAGMFRVANVEFIPEYRQADSSEFVSMASRVQHVVSDTAKICH